MEDCQESAAKRQLSGYRWGCILDFFCYLITIHADVGGVGPSIH